MFAVTVIIASLTFAATSVAQERTTIDKTIWCADSTQLAYRVSYPAGYNPNKQYPVVLAISGGNATKGIVNYCMKHYFQSLYFNDYIIVAPIGTEEYSYTELPGYIIIDYTLKIVVAENTTVNDWVACGTSNGGAAAFNFARHLPSLFAGIIVFPGVIMYDAQYISAGWHNYRVVAAVGEKDVPFWQESHMKLQSMLKGKVQSLKTIIMEGEEHSPSPGYDMNKVYRLFWKD